MRVKIIFLTGDSHTGELAKIGDELVFHTDEHIRFQLRSFVLRDVSHNSFAIDGATFANAYGTNDHIKHETWIVKCLGCECK